MGPIRVRVICGDVQESDNTENIDVNTAALNEPMKARRGPKRKALMPAPFVSPIPFSASAHLALKSERAVEVEERLKLQCLVGKLSDDMKRKEQEVRDLRKKVQPVHFTLLDPSELNLEFKKG